MRLAATRASSSRPSRARPSSASTKIHRGFRLGPFGDKALVRELELVLAGVLGEAQPRAEGAERTGVEPLRQPLGRSTQRSHRRRERADGERSHAGLAKRGRCGRLDLGGVEARAARELDRLDIVVREQLGTILAPVLRKRLDPACDAEMPLHAVRSRELRVDRIPHRHAFDQLDEAVDEVEQPVVRPLQVVEHEHERSPLGQRLEERPPRGEQLGAAIAERHVLRHQTHQGSEARRDPVALGFGNDLVDRARELLRRHGRGVVLVDPRLCLHDLAERPERHAVPVGETTAVAPRDDLLVVRHGPAELGHETALADARHSDERHELRRAVDPHARERPEQERPLVLAPDERRRLLVADASDPPEGLDGLPYLDGIGLALRRDGIVRPVDDQPIGRSMRSGADEDAVDRRRRLDARRRVHHVTRHHRLARRRARVQRHERLPGRDSHPHVKVERVVPVVQLPDGIAHGERRADRALGIVLVRRRCPVNGDDRVADELLDRAPVPLEDRLRGLEVARHDLPQALGVDPLAERRRARDVAEEDGDRLSDLANGSGFRNRRTARVAEPRALAVCGSTRRTDGHLDASLGSRSRPLGRATHISCRLLYFAGSATAAELVELPLPGRWSGISLSVNRRGPAAPSKWGVRSRRAALRSRRAALRPRRPVSSSRVASPRSRFPASARRAPRPDCRSESR